MNFIKKITISLVCLSLVLSVGSLALAQTDPLVTGEVSDEIQQQDQAFLETAGLRSVSLGEVVATVIRTLLAFLGVIFVVLIIYSGFLWMTSAGSEEKIGKAKSIMTAAVIGLVIVLSAYAITIFVLTKILEGTGAGGGGGTFAT